MDISYLARGKIKRQDGRVLKTKNRGTNSVGTHMCLYQYLSFNATRCVGVGDIDRAVDTGVKGASTRVGKKLVVGAVKTGQDWDGGVEGKGVAKIGE